VKRARNEAEKIGPPGANGSKPSYILGPPGRKKAIRFRTLYEAEQTLNRVVNLMVEREKSDLERELGEQTHDQGLEHLGKERQQPQIDWNAA
jgi:hypothetical protein